MKRRVPAVVQVGKFLRMVLPAVVVLFIGALSILGFLSYRITHPPAAPESVNPSHYLLPSLDVGWASRDGTQVGGWWIPGLTGAPCIILVPGYGMSRAAVLSLAVLLRQRGFHLLTYDQRGNGATPKGACSLGLHETEDLAAAVDFVKTRREVNRTRLGIWGVDVGAHAALKVATTCSEIRALAVDAAYDAVTDLLAVRLREDLGTDNRILEFGCRQMFRLYMLVSTASLNEKIPIEALGDRNILFIRGEDQKDLARLTAALYDRIQPQKELVSVPVSRSRIVSGEELKNYDRQVATFFYLNLWDQGR